MKGFCSIKPRPASKTISLFHISCLFCSLPCNLLRDIAWNHSPSPTTKMCVVKSLHWYISCVKVLVCVCVLCVYVCVCVPKHKGELSRLGEYHCWCSFTGYTVSSSSPVIWNSSNLLEKEMATHASVLAWRISGTGSLVGCRLSGHTESDTTEATWQQQGKGSSLSIFISLALWRGLAHCKVSTKGSFEPGSWREGSEEKHPEIIQLGQAE